MHCNGQKASISGEAESFKDFGQIPETQLAALYVAIKHITQEGKEALENLDMCEEDDKIIVRLKHWQIYYQNEAQGLRFMSLRYLKR